MIPSRHWFVKSQQGKHQSDVSNLLNVIGKEIIRTTPLRSFWLSLFLNLNRFHIFRCLYCWFWASKCRRSCWSTRWKMFKKIMVLKKCWKMFQMTFSGLIQATLFKRRQSLATLFLLSRKYSYSNLDSIFWITDESKDDSWKIV